ncbi:MAG: hypothetical protein KTR21_13335 [Rhodobacteraceae bacterium]|nr:hypothetical protein [Paracoccaceae bacterium]
MNTLKKVALASMMATMAIAGTIVISSEAKADHHNFYSYETKYGDFEFYNYDNHWPVVKKVRYYNKWYRCSFWSDRYDCDRDVSGRYGDDYGSSSFKSYNKRYSSSNRGGYNNYHDEDCRD